MYTLTWYEVIQVNARDNGRLHEWWPGDKLGSLAQAKEEKRRLAYQNRGVEYTIIETTVKEVGQALKAKCLEEREEVLR